MSGVALCTGAAGGIGLALVEQLLARGFRVMATDLSADGLSRCKALAGADRLRIMAHDVRSPDAWRAVVDATLTAFGAIDLLLNVAGVLRPAWVQDATAEDAALHLDVNLKGVVLGTQAVVAHMVERGRGHIVNLGSLASLSPVPGLALYAASKFGVRGYSLSVAHELKRAGVAVSVVCPDAVQTPMLDLQKSYEEAALTFSGARSLTAEEVARAVVERVLTERPLELALPRSRGLLAKLAGLWPGVAAKLEPALTRKGRRAQALLRQSGSEPPEGRGSKVRCLPRARQGAGRRPPGANAPRWG